MNLFTYLLLAVGLLLLFLEFFIPGVVLGIAGVVLLNLSIVFFAKSTESQIAILAYVAFVIAAAAFLIWFTLNRIRKGKIKGIFLNEAQEGYTASHWEKELVGKSGEALSDLKPSGHILVEGKRYQAVSKTGYLEKGSKIEVVSGEGAHLIVKLSDLC